MQKEIVGYLRVSTARQGKSGLGLEAQRHAVQSYLRTANAQLIGEFVEIESGRVKERQQLTAALALCRKTKARLCIARLDRLARNAHFLLGLQESGVDFVACDVPEADRFTIGILALVAEREAQLISQRTKDALQAAKRRGVKLGSPIKPATRRKAIATLKRKAAGFAANLKPTIEEINQAGVVTLRGIARCLNARGIPTPLGRSWTRQAVARIQNRLQ